MYNLCHVNNGKKTALYTGLMPSDSSLEVQRTSWNKVDIYIEYNTKQWVHKANINTEPTCKNKV